MAEVVVVDNVKLNDIISFNTWGVSGSVNNVVNGKVLGITTGLNLRNPQSAAVNAANIFGSIPQTAQNPVSNDYTTYTYFLLELVDNSIVEYAFEWIIPTSLTRLQRSTLTAVISDFDQSKLQALQNILTTHGFLNITYTIS